MVQSELFTQSKTSANLKLVEKFALILVGVGFLFAFISFIGNTVSQIGNLIKSVPLFFLLSIISPIVLGTIIYVVSRYLSHPPGIRNNRIMFSSISTGYKGALSILSAVLMTGFYILLYWTDEIGGFLMYRFMDLASVFDPLSYLIRGIPADKWFLYGSIYTLAILIMGFRAIIKYRHSRYQVVRYIIIMIAQTFFAFLIPGILKGMSQPELYFNYFWPLKYDYLFPSHFSVLQNNPGAWTQFLIFWPVMMSFIAVPILTYYYGKRWYCSWVCGCGGLANTLGDNWRQLSDKSLRAWKIERISIYSVLVLIIVTTLSLWFLKDSSFSHAIKKWYGFFIGATFAGVVGTGFYPIFGSRIWCRFGCPQAAILGIIQRFFSRFRITTNGGQCISCGNCSTYCEMGIDVRWYAQRGQNFRRASCVGCGMCSTVCPRGVLNLENGPPSTALNESNSLVDFIKSNRPKSDAIK